MTKKKTLESCSLGTTDRVHVCGDVLLASQPSDADLVLAKESGVKTVINQRHASECPDSDEAASVAALGMAYENPAWSGEEELTEQVIDEHRELLRTTPRPILLHCAGANRVGAVWWAYRVLDEGMKIDAALDEAKRVGLSSKAYEQIVKKYIEGHAQA